MKRFIDLIKKVICPQRCAFCGRVIPAESLMCDECKEKLPRIQKEICMSCGREKELCSCKGETYYNCIAAPFYFDGVVRKGIHAYKFRNFPQNHEAYAVETAKTVSERFGERKFDYILPVPLTSKRIAERGYDQVALIADKLSELISVECRKDLLVKLYETDVQHGLSYYLRRGNLTGVFEVADKEAVRGKTILLFDDISTSGETFNECAKMLWLCDAKEICCVAVALTKPKKDKNKK